METEQFEENIFLASDGTKIVYETHGSGKTILFIHGWAATRNFWFSVRKISGFRTILFDLRGHGDSDKSKDYSKERILKDIAELLETTGTRELILVGHSLGGIIATKFASEFSDYFKVEKLIIVSTPPIFKVGFITRFMMGLLMMIAPAILRKTFTPKTLHKPTKELLEFIWKESAKGSRRAYLAYLKHWNGTSILEDLSELKIPKIAIIPMDDKVTPTSLQMSYYENLCQIETISEAGHNVMIEKPDKFRDVLINQIQKE